MIKQLFTTSFLFVLALGPINAQKVDLDKKTFNVEYVGLPSDNALIPLQSYDVVFTVDPVTVDQLGLTPAAVNSYFQLEGFTYTTAKGEFTYSITIDKVQLIKEGIEEKKQEVKNPDGTMKTVTKYAGSASYAIPTTITLKKSDGTVVYTSTLSSVAQPTVFKLADQDSKETAQTLLSKKDKGINVSVRDLYNKALQAEVTKIKQTYAFRKVSVGTLLWEVDQKKAPELSQFNVELAKGVAVLEKLSYKEPLDKAKQDIAPVLKYWSDQAASINATEKNLKKLKYGHLYNLAKSQYYLELFDECEKTCQLIIDNDYDKSDGKTILEDIKSVKESLAKAGLTSRHLKRPGFDSPAQYVFTPTPIASTTTANTTTAAAPEKKGFIEQNKQDLKDIKNSGASIGKELKKDFGKKVLKDTIAFNEAHFSTLKFMQDGLLIECKEGDLTEGDIMPNDPNESPTFNFVYDLNANKKVTFPKDGELTSVYARFYVNGPRTKEFTSDSLINLIKQYQNGPISDITVDDSEVAKQFYGNIASPKYINPVPAKDYKKRLSIEVRANFHKKGEDGHSYCTKDGDQLTVKVLDTYPVIVTGLNSPSKKGYMVRLLIPEVTMTRIIYGHYSSYRPEQVTLKNVEMRLLIANPYY